MASACVNNLPTSTYSSNWLNHHPTLSSVTTHEHSIISSSDNNNNNNNNNTNSDSSLNNNHNNNGGGGDFNFQLSSNNDTMLPADELFSDGKLIPLQFSTLKPPSTASQSPDAKMSPQKQSPKFAENSNFFSPKAPRCSTRLKEFLGFKKTTASCSSSTHHCKSIKQLLYKNNSKTTSSLSSSSSSGESSLSSPLLSSSSSSSDFCNDLPRLSLDSKRPKNPPIKTLTSGPKIRPVRPKTTTAPTPTAMMESPRMNPSGRVVFEGLERSSSCPSSFNGGIKCKHHYKGSSSGVIERSYSANVNVNARITPVLNVPVCSIRGSSKFGFGQLFSSSSSSTTSNSQKKEGNSYGNNIKTHHHHHHHYHHHHISSSKNKKEKLKESS